MPLIVDIHEVKWSENIRLNSVHQSDEYDDYQAGRIRTHGRCLFAVFFTNAFKYSDYIASNVRMTSE
jgi:hypothetical protein